MPRYVVILDAASREAAIRRLSGMLTVSEEAARNAVVGAVPDDEAVERMARALQGVRACSYATARNNAVIALAALRQEAGRG